LSSRECPRTTIPETEGDLPKVRLAGPRKSPAAYTLRDFLSRNNIPYEWIELGDEPGAGQISLDASVDRGRLPLCVLPDGTRLEAPTIDQLAARLGLLANAELGEYDLAIIGAGPAGLGAAVYGASDGLRTVVFEAIATGGQASLSPKIENYLGFPDGISGAELAHRAREQARRFGAELLLLRRAEHVRLQDGMFVSELSDGSSIPAHSLIAATGVDWRRLDAPGVNELLGVGVYYGASPAEAPWCRDETVAIVGGGNAAGQAAVYYSRFARKIIMLVLDGELDKTMSRYLVDRIRNSGNIEVRIHSRVNAVEGDDRVKAVMVEDKANGETYRLAVDAVFICIGGVPRTEWAVELGILRDRSGYVLTGGDLGPRDPSRWPLGRDPFPLETIIPGLFAAGDVRSGSTKRISAAIGEGAEAVALSHRYLARKT
jgi:thioredoxin reductase (NADPH)